MMMPGVEAALKGLLIDKGLLQGIKLTCFGISHALRWL